MPKPKDAVETLYRCEFYEPTDIMDEDLLYTVPEIGRLLQGLDPEEPLEADVEAILIDWAVPWIMRNADDLVIADPTNEDEPGMYGLRVHETTSSE